MMPRAMKMTASAHAMADSATEKEVRFIADAGLPAAAAGVHAAVEQHIAGAAGGALLTEAAAHLRLLLVVGLRLLLLRSLPLLRVFGAAAVVFDLFFEFIVRRAVLFVGAVHLHGDLELLFALVDPAFAVKDDRLQVVPLGGALVEGVERGLRLGDLALADELLDLGVRRGRIGRRAAFAALGHDLGVGGLDAAEHAGGLVARLPLEEAVLRILLFERVVARLDLLVRRVLGDAKQVVVLFVHCILPGSDPVPIDACRFLRIFASAQHAAGGRGKAAQDDVVRQVVVEVKAQLCKPLGIFREDAAEDEAHFFSVLLQHLRARRRAESCDEGVVVLFLDVFIVVVEGVDEVHPLADAVAQGAGILGGGLAEAVVREVGDEQREGVGGAVDAGAVLPFERAQCLHMRGDARVRFGEQLLRAAGAAAHPRADKAALALVLHVVGRLVVGERGIEAGDLAGEVVVGGHVARHEGVQHAAPPFDAHVLTRQVVQKRGQKCHVVGERHARALAAAAAQALA